MMKNIYNDFKEGLSVKSIARISALVIIIMAWILIDKGNVYGQSIATGKASELSGKSDVIDSSFLKSGGGDDGGILDDGSDFDEDNTFTVFPNPVQGDLVFDFEFTVREGAPFEVIDPQGKLVEAGLVKPGIDQLAVDLSKLKAGLYIVRVELGGKLQVKRIIKQ